MMHKPLISMNKRVAALAAAAFAVASALSAPAAAQDRRPVRLVVPFAPGGPVDLGARVIAPKLEERTKMPFIVDNRPGGNAAVGANAVMNAAADCHTLFMQTVSVMTPVLIKDFAIDFSRDFEPVAPVWNVSYYLFVNASLPIHNLQEFVAYAKANNGKLNYAAGTVSTMLMMETVKTRYGLDMAPIQYKGSAPAGVALVANEVQANFDVAGVLKPYLEAGKVRALFSTGKKRSVVLPDVPTVGEIGAPDLQFALTGGLWTRKGTPQPLVEELNKATSESMALPDVKERFASIGWDTNNGSREELLRAVRSEMDFIARAAKAANYKPE